MFNHFTRTASWGFLCLVAMILANSAISYHHLSRLREIGEQINRTNQALLALEQTLSLVKDVETGGRSYALSGEPAYLEPFLGASRQLDSKLDQLEQYFSSEQEQLAELREIRTLVDESIAFAKQAVSTRDTAGEAAAEALISRAAGQHPMDRIRELAANVELGLAERQHNHAVQAQQSFETALATFVVATTSAVALMVVVFVLIRREIVDSQRHAEELRRYAADSHNQRQWLETVMNLLPMPMVLVDTRRSRVILANREAEASAGGQFPLLTHSDTAAPQTHATDLAGTPIPPHQMPLARVAHGETLSGFELNWHLPDGPRSLLINADRLPAMYGHEEVSAVLFQDITRLKQIEAELRRTNRSKDALLAMLGHELRNPLAAITSASELLRLLPPSDPLYRQSQEILARHLAHLKQLINEMLDFSRISSGKFRMNLETLDLASVVENSVQTVRSQIEARRHQLSVQMPQEAVFVKGDAARLEQVLVNLLLNAAKYTDPGGQISVLLEASPQLAVLRVRDSGVGIDPQRLPQIFEMFGQLNPSSDRSAGGLGIGLNVAKSIVELHQGTVEAHSDGLGQGAEFIVRLPQVEAPAPRNGGATPPAPAVLSPAPAAPPEHPARVMVVDDNRDIARVMAALVRRCGHEPCIAYDGPMAMEVAHQFHPDIAFLDIGLPGMSGHELARNLRNDEELHDMRLIALTGYGQEEDRRRSREAGFDDHLTKPISLAMLHDVLDHVKKG